MFLFQRRFNDGNCIRRGKGLFQPDFRQLLKTVALDFLVLGTLGSLSGGLVFVQSSISSPCGPARLTGLLAFAGYGWRRAEGDCEHRHAPPPRSDVARPLS
jgi:hypothetical protein